MNKSDSERIASFLEKLNYKEASNEEEADLIVVNMCSVRQSAVDRVYGLARKFSKIKEKSPNFKSVLTGCYSKKDFKKFKKIFDFILPIKTLPKWEDFLKKESFYFEIDQRDKNFNKKFNLFYLKEKPKYSKNFSVFVPISSGCDNFCSFCIVPFVRGPLICRDFFEILKEVKEAVKNGAKEIWLLGQNVNDYQFEGKDFAGLIEQINKIEGNFWIRFTSPHPKNFSQKLIETIAKCEKVTPYLNLPLQSGDDETLKRMRRGYTAAEYLDLVRRIRMAFKKYRKGLEREVAISTDIIVGFPGETKKQFEKTLKIFKKIKFDMAYIAKYSPRPHTLAEKMENNVEREEKEKRYKVLTEILRKIALERNKKFVGEEVEVLVEKEKDGFLFGKSRHYKTVKFEGKPQFVGKILKVKIIEALPWGLKGCLTK